MTTDLIAPSPKTAMALKILILADTPAGYQKALQQFLSFLSKDVKYAEAYQEVVEEIAAESQAVQDLKMELLKWLGERITDLRRCRCSQMGRVERAIDQVDLMLTGQSYLVVLSGAGGYFGTILRQFREVCGVVAEYGKDEATSSWMTINEGSTCFIVDGSPKPKKFGINIDPFGRIGQQLADRLNTGFLSAKAESGAKLFDPKKIPRYHLKIGFLDGLAYPSCYAELQKLWSLKERCIDQDVSAKEILSNLQWMTYSDGPRAMLTSPTTVLKADEFTNQVCLQQYVSSFRTTDWTKAPKSRDELAKMVERLLVLLSLYSLNKKSPIGKRGTRSNKDEAKQFIEAVLRTTWEAMQLKRFTPRNFNPLRLAIMEGVAKASQNISQAVSDKMIKKQLTVFARAVGFKPKRGKAVRKKG